VCRSSGCSSGSPTSGCWRAWPAATGSWKGGFALQLRYGLLTRPTKDVDLRTELPVHEALELLRRAVEAAGASAGDATDECALVERLGLPVALVPGEPGNFKITTPEDVERAERLVSTVDA
jgi:hypothetical protein